MRSRWGDSSSTSGRLQHSRAITGLKQETCTNTSESNWLPNLPNPPRTFLLLQETVSLFMARRQSLDKSCLPAAVLESVAFHCASLTNMNTLAQCVTLCKIHCLFRTFNVTDADLKNLSSEIFGRVHTRKVPGCDDKPIIGPKRLGRAG